MMKRSTMQQLSLAMLGAVLVAGCATGTPNAGGGGGAPGDSAASTTGDADACAIALGNVDANLGTTGVGAQPEPTANGLLLGNVALVALPSADDMPITGTTTGVGGGGAAQTTMPGDGAKGTATTDTTGAAGTGTVGPTATGADRAGGTSAEVTAPNGSMAGPAAGGGGAANPTAIDRIRTACPKVTQILVVTDTGDRARLAQISMSVRKGQPVTAFLDEVSGMAKKATPMGGGAGSTFQPGETPARTTAPAAPPTQGALTPAPAGGTTPVSPITPTSPTTPGSNGAGGGGPAPGTYGTAPGQMGPGTAPATNR